MKLLKNSSQIELVKMYFKGGKNSRGNQRVSSYDPDDSLQQPANDSTKASQQGLAKPGTNTSQPPTLGSTRKFAQKIPTISTNYNEKSMLLSSDEEYQ